jgi:hypothetical protein
MEEVKLAEVISRVYPAVLGDLIPVNEWYSIVSFILRRISNAWEAAATVGTGVCPGKKAAARWFAGG